MSKLAVLVSGTGSILEAMVKDGLPIEVVLADRHCRGLEIAESAGIPRVLLWRSFSAVFDREAYTRRSVEMLQCRGVYRIAMAGYMTVFTQAMFDAFGGRITNTHPSLLPAFKGDHAVRDALHYGVKVTGCTIHVATIELDAGPILAQEPVRVLKGDTVDTLHERIKQVERVLYPTTIRELLATDTPP